METAQLEAEVYAALVGDETLMGFLPEGGKSIFHLQAPAVYPDYPILVYSPISDVPALHGDNRENLHRVIIRIHIIAEDYTGIYAAVKRIMAEHGFTRVQAMPYIDADGKRILIADFEIVIGG